jgi:hypothetical protein
MPAKQRSSGTIAVGSVDKEVICIQCYDRGDHTYDRDFPIDHKALPHGIVCNNCGALHVRVMETKEMGWKKRTAIEVMGACIADRQSPS